MKNIWLNGIMGVVVGDALGVPVEFSSRNELKINPLVKMEGYGSYDVPEGTWSDDSSMMLATLDSLKNGYNPTDIMEKFADWLVDGKYTPFGEAFDVGRTCLRAIMSYLKGQDITKCGGNGELDNGNGSLMRIMPICLYMYEKQRAENLTDAEVLEKIHEVSALTHAHMRSKIACGLYFFMVRSILDAKQENFNLSGCDANKVYKEEMKQISNAGVSKSKQIQEIGVINRKQMVNVRGIKRKILQETLQKGLDDGFAHYAGQPESATELSHYERLRNLEEFKSLPEEKIASTGYVVATLEAVLWSLIRTENYKDAMLTAVNLGDDTDTVAAIAGGLGGLYYGYEGIPGEWLKIIQRREWVEEMCGDMM